MRHPDPQLLLRIAMADAAAAGAEYLKFPRDQAVRDRVLAFTRYVAHPTHGHPAGDYTDDAEMSIANALVLLEHGPPFPRYAFADAYVHEFAFGGRRNGYARGFQAFLESVTDGADFLARIRPDSDKNGAAMRAVPIGVLPTVEAVLEAATVQATLTHDTAVGRFSARAVALMAHYALYEEGPLSAAPAWCLARLPSDDVVRFRTMLEARWSGRPVMSYDVLPVGLTTVQAVADLVAHQPSLMAILEQAICWGGDTDSVAAIAWGIASPRFQDEKLPAFLEHDLERRSAKTGATRLRDIGARLMAKYA